MQGSRLCSAYCYCSTALPAAPRGLCSKAEKRKHSPQRETLVAFHDRFYPELLLLHEEDKRLIKVGVEVAHLDGGLLLLADPLTLPVQQLYLHVGICGGRRARTRMSCKTHCVLFICLTDNTFPN